MTAARRTAAVVLAAVLAVFALVTASDGSPAPARATPGSPVAQDTACAAPGWVGVWSMPTSDALGPAVPAGSTLREIVYPHLGGRRVRVHLSNRLAGGPVEITAVTIAARGDGAALRAGSVTPLLFGGARAVTIPAGAQVTSDPANFAFAGLQDLAVSIYLAHGAATPAEHLVADEVDYRAASGDRSGDPSAAGFTRVPTSDDPASPFSSATVLSGVDAYAPVTQGAVVALGDSLTDGLLVHGSAAEARWPDALARRLAAAGVPLSVVDAGISGNLVTQGSPEKPYGLSALDRYDADVAAQAGVRTVILYEGINDIHQGVTPGAIEAADTELITRAHAAGLRILLATLTPAGLAGRGAATAAFTAARLELNVWIRSQRLADGVIDFEQAVADPDQPTQLSAGYDGGDHLHLSPAGYARLAAVVPLSLLLPAGCIPG